MFKFPCTKCGACCRRAGVLFDDWPWLKEDGKTCAKLNEDNTCSIYEIRPLRCRVDETYSMVDKLMNRITFYKDTARQCNDAIVEDGMDKSFLVQLGGI